MIKWNDSFKVGVEVIDTQHQRLFEIAEQVYNLLEMPGYCDRYDDIIKIADELKEYTKFHFAEEQKLMLEVGYRKFFSHKVTHDDFIEQIDSIDIYTMDENQTKYLIELVDFITTWITEHIMKTDKYLAQWCNQEHK